MDIPFNKNIPSKGIDNIFFHKISLASQTNRICRQTVIPNKDHIILIFLKLWFTPSKAEQPLPEMVLQEKEAQQDYSIQEICLERTSRLNATNIIGQRKAFKSQRILDSS